MFTRQPEYVVKRHNSIVFHGTISECEKFFEWLGNEYPHERYEVEPRK